MILQPRSPLTLEFISQAKKEKPSKEEAPKAEEAVASLPSTEDGMEPAALEQEADADATVAAADEDAAQVGQCHHCQQLSLNYSI